MLNGQAYEAQLGFLWSIPTPHTQYNKPTPPFFPLSLFPNSQITGVAPQNQKKKGKKEKEREK